MPYRDLITTFHYIMFFQSSHIVIYYQALSISYSEHFTIFVLYLGYETYEHVYDILSKSLIL